MRFDALYERRNAFQGRTQRLTRFSRILVGLQPYPEAIAQGEDARQTQPGIGADRPSTGQDFADTLLRYTDGLR